jgi:hypothetical protein
MKVSTVGMQSLQWYRLACWSLLAYVIAVPMMIAPKLPLFRYKLQMAEVVFLVMLACTVAGWVEGSVRTPDLGVAEGLLLSYLLAAGLSTAFAEDRILGLVDFGGEVYLAGVFFLLTALTRSETGLRRLLYAWWLGFSIVVCFGWLGLVLAYGFGIDNPWVMRYSEFPYLGEFYRVLSLMRPTAKMLSTYLVLSLSLLMGLVLSEEDKRRRRILLIPVVLGGCLFPFTLSRDVLGLVVAMLILVWVSPSRGLWIRFARAGLATAAAGLLVTTLFISTWHITAFRASREQDRIAGDILNSQFQGMLGWYYADRATGLTRLRVEVEYVFSGYHLLKRAALLMVRERPLLGVGVGNFEVGLKRLREEELLPREFGNFEHAQSTPFGIAAETGLMGLGLLGAMWFVLLGQVRRSALTLAGRRQAWICSGISAGLIGLLASSIHVDIMHFRYLWVGLAVARIAGRLYDPRSLGSTP